MEKNLIVIRAFSFSSCTLKFEMNLQLGCPPVGIGNRLSLESLLENLFANFSSWIEFDHILVSYRSDSAGFCLIPSKFYRVQSIASEDGGSLCLFLRCEKRLSKGFVSLFSLCYSTGSSTLESCYVLDVS